MSYIKRESYQENSELIPIPLWNLMLSTNNCYPGCGCEDDFFDMTLTRVKSWVLRNDYKKALVQIDELLMDSEMDVGDLQIQTGYPFQRFEEVENWLLEWKSLILKSIKE